EALKGMNTEKLSADELRQLYIDVVARVIDRFLAGVRRNIRNRVFANPLLNLKAMLPGGYDRTVRLGELLGTELFAETLPETEKAKARRGGIYLTDLKVNPAGEAAPFDAKTDNWRRRAKVPILVLNATSLNTGHNWQYTVTWMGESPHAIAVDVDG